MRLLQTSEVLDVVPDLYDHCRRRTGSISRPRWYLERELEDVLGGKKSAFVAVHLDASGTPDGFVHYNMAWDESENDDTGRGEVHDLFGADAAVERALWAYVLGIDLIDEWRAEQRPVDEADPVRVRRHACVPGAAGLGRAVAPPARRRCGVAEPHVSA